MQPIKNAESLTIRFLTEEDAVAWRKLRLEALEQDPEAFSSSVEEHRRLAVEDVKTRISDDPAVHFTVGAFVNGQLAGMAGFYREQGPKIRHKGRIWGVYLTAGVRGRGIGRSMMQALLGRATKLPGIELIQLSVTTGQTAAIGLYRSLGFIPFGREPNALKVDGRYLDEDYLVLDLSAGTSGRAVKAQAGRSWLPG